MDFTLDDEQKLLRDTTRDLLARSYDAERRREIVGTERGWSTEVWRRFAEVGLLGLSFSEADGGMGAGPVEIGAVMTEIGRRLAPEPLLDAVLVPGALVASAGTDEQRSALLPEVASGERLLAFAHSEPGVRWPAAVVSTTAQERGESWSLTGVKNPVLHGVGAHTLVVSAALPEHGTGLFLVDAGGLDSGGAESAGGTSEGEGRGVHVTGYRTYDGARAAQIEFVDAPARLLGGDPAADASPLVEDALVRAQAALCAEAVGAMDEALRLTTEYLRTRKQFGVPLSSFEALTHRAADMYVLLELARSMSLYATMSLADGTVDPIVASRAKLQIGRSGKKIAQEAIQMHGGIGMTDEYPVGHYSARLTAIDHVLGSADDHLRILAAHARGA
ncbi:acyl-CoA dehydrogenase family protein [Rhodococcus sp. HNM0569]|uniref:acyl-CoA dehydrogenase family protein n=1 Tax=Rhodococcus sp. HNM0569 TaxID=2716340 RepID=UPI00146E611A|nr:acyl-CoA dehydrogenase family protein [Rhodococcus sp. HNM0569]NLU83932.1 acyl-CoA dehydrogenase [Rhodococcus sp. HNM0569]